VREARRAAAVMLEPKTPWVAEHVAMSPARYWEVLGWPGLLALGAPAALLVLDGDRRARLPRLFAALAAALLVLEWLRVRDYEYLAPPLVALGSALVVHATVEAVPPLRAPWRRRLAVGVVALLAAVPVWPLRAHPLPALDAQAVRGMAVLTEGWDQALRWMARHTPEPTLPVEARVPPFGDFHYPAGTYGVVSSWDHGNLVAALARRPVVASQGVSRPVAAWLLATDEQSAMVQWDVLMQPGERVRYAVIGSLTVSEHVASLQRLLGRDPADLVERQGPRGLPVYNDRFTRSLMWRLYHDAARDLAHHRLVYQSPHRSLLYFRLRAGGADASLRLRSAPMDGPGVAALLAGASRQPVLRTDEGLVYAPQVLPTVRVFEIVPGATVSGTAAPGSTVEARLTLRSRTDGEAWEYRRTAPVARDGRFALTLPYSTEPSPHSDVAALDRYELLVDTGADRARVGRLDVPERVVQAGGRLDVGRLAPVRPR
jgi:dolichyl-diphosphooligosaccharide--protein glycosyltransferase